MENTEGSQDQSGALAPLPPVSSSMRKVVSSSEPGRSHLRSDVRRSSSRSSGSLRASNSVSAGTIARLLTRASVQEDYVSAAVEVDQETSQVLLKATVRDVERVSMFTLARTTTP